MNGFYRRHSEDSEDIYAIFQMHGPFLVAQAEENVVTRKAERSFEMRGSQGDYLVLRKEYGAWTFHTISRDISNYYPIGNA